MQFELQSTSLRQSRERYFNDQKSKRGGKSRHHSRSQKHLPLSPLTQCDLSTGIDLDSCRNINQFVSFSKADVQPEYPYQITRQIQKLGQPLTLSDEICPETSASPSPNPPSEPPKRKYHLTVVSRLPTSIKYKQKR